MGFYFDDDEDGYGGICECGVVDDLEDGLCRVCAAAPHHRECPCDECDAYWSRIEAESRAAVERYHAERRD